jgi:hypothetical protein
MAMKKSLIALAALGAFAGAASAQSSVTLFGIVDVNVMTVNNNDRTYSMGTDGMASSRLGFRGVEDLGGGMKASFWLEAGLAPDTGRNTMQWGNGGTSTGGENALVFNRRSTVSLSNRWGELRLGRDYTPTFWNWTNYDPFGTVGVGAATNLALSKFAVTTLSGPTEAGYGTLVRANNMVSYILPAGTQGMGLYGQLSVAAGEKANANKYYGGRIGYAAGPFDMLAFILRRLYQAVIVMLTVAFIAFMLFQYVGDPVTNLLGQDATPEQRDAAAQGPRAGPAVLRAVRALRRQRGAGRVRPEPAPGPQGVGADRRALPATLELSLAPP